MRAILFCLLIVTSAVQALELAEPVPVPVENPIPPQAQAPETVVAQTVWPSERRITLLTQSCGWPGGAMRAQEITATRQIRWGCWGYNETGVQVQWSTGRTDHLDYLELWTADQSFWRQMGYRTLHQRVLRLRNGG